MVQVFKYNNLFKFSNNTDMRGSIDGLMPIVIDHLHMMPE